MDATKTPAAETLTLRQRQYLLAFDGDAAEVQAKQRYLRETYRSSEIRSIVNSLVRRGLCAHVMSGVIRTAAGAAAVAHETEDAKTL